MKQSALAAEQFGATASAYLTSAVHAQGADLKRLAELAANMVAAHAAQGIEALDMGCGAGHAAFNIAQAGAGVVAYDISEGMLTVVSKEAAARSLTTLKTKQGPAERLPFDDATFDLVATRFSAHHWSDVPAALKEVRRVLKPTGSFVVIDVVGPEAPLLDTVMQTVEILRDASHVRDYQVSQWKTMLREAGFDAPESDAWKLHMEFASWVARMRTPQVRIDAIRDVLAKAPEEARAYFAVKDDDSFDIDAAWFKTQPSQ